MLARLILRLAISCGVLVAAAGISAAQPQEPTCRFFKVADGALNIFKEPRGASDFVARLAKDDIVCVTRDQQVGELAWAYVAYKLAKHNQRTSLEGWGITRALQPATPAEVAALRAAPDPAPFSTAEGPAPAQDVVRFSEPITFGPLPVNGHSLEQLIEGIPLFPPIEGLEDSVWKKPCSACHKWDRKTLCAQGAIYAKDPKTEMRTPHPYGGAEKIAMMKWAQGGCQ